MGVESIEVTNSHDVQISPITAPKVKAILRKNSWSY